MRTPLDAFHQALVNLVEERRRTEQPVRRRRRIGVTAETARAGMMVTLRIPKNLAQTYQWKGVVPFDGMTGPIRVLHHESATVEFPGADLMIPYIAMDMADPPPSGNNIEEIERWLAS